MAVSRTFGESYAGTGSSGTVTIPSQTTGTATADRITAVFVGISTYVDAAVASSGLTMDNGTNVLSATKYASVALNNFSGSSGRSWEVSLWWALNPDGTGCDYEFTYSPTGVGNTIVASMTYEINGADTSAPFSSSASQTGDTVSSRAASLTIPTNGAGFGMSYSGTAAASGTWTNLTEDSDGLQAGSGFLRGCASSVSAGASTRTSTYNVSQGVALLLLAAAQEPVPGQPISKRMGGVTFVGNRAGQNTKLWRKALGWRQTLSGLLIPSKPTIVRA